MDFFNASVDGIKNVITAIGGGVGVLGIINYLEGYGSDNAASKSQGVKHVIPDLLEQ